MGWAEATGERSLRGTVGGLPLRRWTSQRSRDRRTRDRHPDGPHRARTRPSRALDVGAGTGLSSPALLPHWERVVGLDPSAGMPGAATSAPNLTHVRGKAESLPCRARSAQLTTTGCASRWCDRDPVFSESSGV
ncbi:MAG: class I SAM-dependent methyltransferase [Myxococcota bacterium]